MPRTPAVVRERHARFLDLFEAGHRVCEIALAAGVHHATVSKGLASARRRRDAGLPVVAVPDAVASPAPLGPFGYRPGFTSSYRVASRREVAVAAVRAGYSTTEAARLAGYRSHSSVVTAMRLANRMKSK